MQKFYNSKKKLIAEGGYADSLPDGFWKYHTNGKVEFQGKYVRGKKDSLWVEGFMEESVYIREYKAGEFTFREQYFFKGQLSSKKEAVDEN